MTSGRCTSQDKTLVQMEYGPISEVVRLSQLMLKNLVELCAGKLINSGFAGDAAAAVAENVSMATGAPKETLFLLMAPLALVLVGVAVSGEAFPKPAGDLRSNPTATLDPI